MPLTLDNIIDDTCQKASIDRQNQQNITNLIRWVNIVQSDICNRYAWPWLTSRTQVTSVIDKTAGTVDATLGSTTVSGTTTSFASTDVGRFIQFSSSNDWYRISAQSSGTSLTLETAYAPATETGMTYTIRTFSYNLPNDVRQVFDVRQFRTPMKLVPLDTRYLDLLRPNQTATGNPRGYFLYVYNNPQSATGQNYAISFEPIPSVAMVIEIRYLIRPPSLSAGTDISVIPSNYQHLLIDGTLVHAYQWQGNPSTGGQKQVYEAGINQMKNEMPQSADIQHILQPIDQLSSNLNPVPFPAEYGFPYSA